MEQKYCFTLLDSAGLTVFFCLGEGDVEVEDVFLDAALPGLLPEDDDERFLVFSFL